MTYLSLFILFINLLKYLFTGLANYISVFFLGVQLNIDIKEYV